MIVVVGKSGQLAQELNFTKNEREVAFLGRAEVNVLNSKLFIAVLKKYQPTVIINAAAYTAVDDAETDFDAAFALNRDAVEIIAIYCQEAGCRLLHVSTDFVFDGEKSTPYKVDDAPNPLSVYGLSKLAGEQAIQRTMDHNYAIVRTSWLYSSFGHNFVKNMLRLMNERDEISVVNDQIGSPTNARGLAEYIWTLVESDKLVPVYHYSDAGEISWYKFACEIYRLGKLHGLIQRDVRLKPITTKDYSTSAKRPRYSILQTNLTHDWHQQLRKTFLNLTQ